MIAKKRKYRVSNVNYNAGAIAEEISNTLDIFRIDFFNNIEYLLKYTGLKRASFHKEMRRHGVKSSLLALNKIRDKKVFNFDLYIVGAAAHIFKVPIKVILNMDIEKKELDLEPYGLYENCYTGRKYKADGVKYSSEQVESEGRSMIKKIRKVAQRDRDNAVLKANSPEPIWSFWMEFDKTGS